MLWPGAVVVAAAAGGGEVEDGAAAVIRDPVVVVFPGLAAAVIRDRVVVIIPDQAAVFRERAVAIILVLGAVIILARPPVAIARPPVAIARPPVATLIARASKAPTETTRMLIVAVAGERWNPTSLTIAQPHSPLIFRRRTSSLRAESTASSWFKGAVVSRKPISLIR